MWNSYEIYSIKGIIKVDIIKSPKINYVFDATMFDTFLDCPQKFNLRHIQNRVTPEKQKPLDRGGIMHVGFESYYKALAEGKKWEDAITAGLVDMRFGLASDSDLSTDDGNRCLEVFEESATFWRADDLSWEIVAVEKPFLYVLYEDDTFRIAMMGKIDLLRSNNRYTNCPMDHKTYERDFPVTRLTNQFQNYAFATKSDYLFVNRVGFQTSLKSEKKHKRIPLSYDAAILSQWRTNVIRWVMHYHDCAVSNEWPLNTTSCGKYNRLCEYHGICDTSGEENKIYKLETQFRKDTPWDVSYVLSKKG